MPKRNKEKMTRTQVRIPTVVYKDIQKVRPDGCSLNYWLIEAAKEKIERDRE